MEGSDCFQSEDQTPPTSLLKEIQPLKDTIAGHGVMSLIPTLRKQRQVHLCELAGSVQ